MAIGEILGAVGKGAVKALQTGAKVAGKVSHTYAKNLAGKSGGIGKGDSDAESDDAGSSGRKVGSMLRKGAKLGISKIKPKSTGKSKGRKVISV